LPNSAAREKRVKRAQKQTFTYALLAALERCCDSFLIVEKTFSVTDPTSTSIGQPTRVSSQPH